MPTRTRGGETAYTATKLPVAKGAPVLRQHPRGNDFVRDYQDVEADDSDEAMEADDSDEAMEAAAADRPVFRLDPAAG